MASRPAPRDLRASDADRDRVIALLGEAAADGRLTLEEHSERADQAYSARTLGDLAGLTADLAAPAAQPFQLEGGRAVTGLLRRELRDGRWVVPERMVASAVFGEVTLDLRQAMLQSNRIIVFATVIGGTLRLIVPDEVCVQVTGSAMLGRATGGVAAGRGVAGGRAEPAPRPDQPVIEVRTFALAGRVRVIRPRRSRWPRLRRPGGQQLQR
jgi:hypothetical protein